MKLLSATFLLILLLVPFSLAQSNILNFMEKTSEGKEVLDYAYIAMASQGPHRSVRALKTLIRKMALRLKRGRRNSRIRARKDAKIYKANITAAVGLAHFFILGYVALKRYIFSLKRKLGDIKTMLQRSAQELGLYFKLRRINKFGQKLYIKWYDDGLKNYYRLLSLVSQLRAHVRRLHKRHRKKALIELPSGYTTALNEIHNQFESIDYNFQGLRPIITNVIEIAKDKKHLFKKKFRKSLRKIFHFFSYHLYNALEGFREINARQRGLYSAVNDLLTDSTRRLRRLFLIVKGEAKGKHLLLTRLKKKLSGARCLVKKAKYVARLLIRKCHFMKRSRLRENLRVTRLLRFITQVDEVISERWRHLKAYFIQREDRERELN